MRSLEPRLDNIVTERKERYEERKTEERDRSQSRWIMSRVPHCSYDYGPLVCNTHFCILFLGLDLNLWP